MTTSTELNPENKCAHLVNTSDVKLPNLEEMFDMQLQLQRFLLTKKEDCFDYDNATFKERVDEITVQWRNITLEFAELLERLPFKEWKTYSPEQLEDWLNTPEGLEVKFEYTDMWHFFMNIGLLLKVGGEEFRKLYYLKNKENIDRQESGRY
jgi:dimeric dUTPase (all-alpha-NTP-PPase superfamily)